MLCYVMLCYAMSCYVMLCYVMLFEVQHSKIECYDLSCNVINLTDSSINVFRQFNQRFSFDFSSSRINITIIKIKYNTALL